MSEYTGGPLDRLADLFMRALRTDDPQTKANLINEWNEEIKFINSVLKGRRSGMIEKSIAISNLRIIKTWAECGKKEEPGINPIRCEQVERWINEVIQLLEAQEPRLMTLEEVKEAGGIVYYESKGDDVTPAYVYKVGADSYDIMTMGNDEYQNEKGVCYGVDWRCWTAWPTKKQREAVKWDADIAYKKEMV